MCIGLDVVWKEDLTYDGLRLCMSCVNEEGESVHSPDSESEIIIIGQEERCEAARRQTLFSAPAASEMEKF